MQFLRRVTLCCLALAIACQFSGCASVNPTGANPRIPANSSAAQLRAGDSLNVVLQGIPDPATNTVTIDDRGLITLPYIGELQAAGLTEAELSAAIRDTYVRKKIYNMLDVTVSVTERFVYVGGEVQRAGRIVWTPDLTVAKAVQSAGGFTLYAKETAVSLVRDKQAYVIDVKLAQKDPAQDPRLVPGDSLHVPRSPF